MLVRSEPISVPSIIVFQNGADNALVTNYQGCQDNMLVQTQGDGNRGAYLTSGVGSMPWANESNPVRTVMRWDLSAMAGLYADIKSLTDHNQTSAASLNLIIDIICHFLH